MSSLRGALQYSVWDGKCFPLLQQGAEIEYTVRESGNFRHLNDIKPVDQPQAATAYPVTARDRQIARLSCLKSASEIAAPVPMDLDDKQELVVDLAKRFERYVYDGGPTRH